MIRFAYIVVSFLLLAGTWAANDVGKDFRNDLNEISSICDGSYCPSYTVIETANDYEFREYNSHYVAQSEITNIDQRLAKIVLFLRLKGYTMGDNVAHENVQRGLPIYSSYFVRGDWSLVGNFSKAFFLSQKFSEKIPAPLNPYVQLLNWQSKSCYAASYTGGFLTLDEVIGHANTLAQALKRDNRTFLENEFTVAYYDKFEKHSQRHHGIFFIAT